MACLGLPRRCDRHCAARIPTLPCREAREGVWARLLIREYPRVADSNLPKSQRPHLSQARPPKLANHLRSPAASPRAIILIHSCTRSCIRNPHSSPCFPPATSFQVTAKLLPSSHTTGSAVARALTTSRTLYASTLQPFNPYPFNPSILKSFKCFHPHFTHTLQSLDFHMAKSFRFLMADAAICL